jgi:hypothetical protein
MKTVKFIKEGDYELAYISGKIQVRVLRTAIHHRGRMGVRVRKRVLIFEQIQPDGVPVLTELPPDRRQLLSF